MSKLQQFIFAGFIFAFLVSGSNVYAVDARKTPDAPADFLAKTNPFTKALEDFQKTQTSGKKPEKKKVSSPSEDPVAFGKDLYEKKCQKCHGLKGEGDGKSAEGLNPPVMSFIKDGYLKGRKDGQLFWIIANGSPKTDMEAFGSGSSYNFSDEQIWSLVTFMRSKFSK